MDKGTSCSFIPIAGKQGSLPFSMDTEYRAEGPELKPAGEQFPVVWRRPIRCRPMKMISADIRGPVRNSRGTGIDPLRYLVTEIMPDALYIRRPEGSPIPLLT